MSCHYQSTHWLHQSSLSASLTALRAHYEQQRCVRTRSILDESRAVWVAMRLIIYTGKGGTGKTVTSCSTAIKLAEHNHKTLVISSDPAHTLGDAFMVSNIGYEMQKILPNLEALQIDPVTEMKKHFDTYISQS